MGIILNCLTSRLSPLESTDTVDGFQLTAPSGGCIYVFSYVVLDISIIPPRPTRFITLITTEGH
jgi:hypothetical protein